jgi:hypothetical protein
LTINPAWFVKFFFPTFNTLQLPNKLKWQAKACDFPPRTMEEDDRNAALKWQAKACDFPPWTMEEGDRNKGLKKLVQKHDGA